MPSLSQTRPWSITLLEKKQSGESLMVVTDILKDGSVLRTAVKITKPLAIQRYLVLRNDSYDRIIGNYDRIEDVSELLPSNEITAAKIRARALQQEVADNADQVAQAAQACVI